MIYGTYGIHPHEAKNDKVKAELIINGKIPEMEF